MSGRVYRFSSFELHLDTGEVRSASGTVVRLQEKPLRLLCALLDHPQRLVTREQLRDQLWDTRTVVDFEQGINVAIQKVRAAVADPAGGPSIIETIPRKGYRLLAAVTILQDGGPGSTATQDPDPPATAGTVEASLAGVSAAGDRGRGGRFLWALLYIPLTLGIGALAMHTYGSGSRHARSISSIAVLPMRNVSPDPGQDFLAEGITDEITTRLAETLPQRVISRSSAQRYRNPDRSITAIAKELGVDAIIEGSVARSGDRVSISVQLIDPAEDRHIWGQQYERDARNLLTMESELSAAIAERVGGALSGRPAARPPEAIDARAHDLYLMGTYHRDKRTAADLAQAEQDLLLALERVPEYGPAHAALATVYALMPSYGPYPWEPIAAKAEAQARRSLQIDDTLAEAHATLGFLWLNRSRDWERSESELRRAIEIDPSFATAHHWFSYQRFFVGRTDEALREITLARQLDPLSAVTNADEGHFLYAARRFDEARFRLRRAIELQSDLGQPHSSLALLEQEAGHPELAVREAHAALALDPTNPRTIGEAGYVLARTGREQEARRLLAQLDTLEHQGSLRIFSVMIELGLGHTDRARQSLESGLRQGVIAGVQPLGQWHAFDPIRAALGPVAVTGTRASAGP